MSKSWDTRRYADWSQTGDPWCAWWNPSTIPVGADISWSSVMAAKHDSRWLLWFWKVPSYFFWRFAFLFLSLGSSDLLFLLDTTPTGLIFISVKSRDVRWPFHGSQFTPWQQESRLREEEIRKRQAMWQRGRMTNTNKYQPLASFHVSTNLFWLLLHFADKHCRRHPQLQYYGWNLNKSGEIPRHFLRYQSPLDIITVVATLSAW